MALAEALCGMENYQAATMKQTAAMCSFHTVAFRAWALRFRVLRFRIWAFRF